MIRRAALHELRLPNWRPLSFRNSWEKKPQLRGNEAGADWGRPWGRASGKLGGKAFPRLPFFPPQAVRYQVCRWAVSIAITIVAMRPCTNPPLERAIAVLVFVS